MSLLLLLVGFIHVSFAGLPCSRSSPFCVAETRHEFHSLNVSQRVAVSLAVTEAHADAVRNGSDWTTILADDVSFRRLVSRLDERLRWEGLRLPFYNAEIDSRADARHSSLLRVPPRFDSYLFLVLGKVTKISDFTTQAGLEETGDECARQCPHSSPWVFCVDDRCVASVVAGGACPGNEPFACFESTCLRGVCSTQETSQDLDEGSGLGDMDSLLNFTTRGDEEGLRADEKKEEDLPGLLAAAIAGASLEALENATLPGSSTPAVASSTASPTSVTTSSTTTPIAPLKDRSSSHRKISPWKEAEKKKKKEIPTAFFTATVVEGSLRRAAASRRIPEEVRVETRGMNMPSGYTQTMQGWQSANSSSLVLPFLDPALSGALVELEVDVRDSEGRECVHYCLTNPRKASYKECDKNTVRLSVYSQFSDPIPWFQSSEEALEAEWSGGGYYRRRTPTFLLFKCPRKQERKRRNRTRRLRLNRFS